MQARPIPCFPAGKLTHSGANQLSDSSHSLVDYNRAGIPLLEIVSEPDMHTGQEAAAYGAELRRIMVYLGISDCNMSVSLIELAAPAAAWPPHRALLVRAVRL